MNPKYCPMCKNELDTKELEGEVFDCYCNKCEWSGDISPDGEDI